MYHAVFLVATIDRLNLGDVHALRQSDSGGSPPRMRGEDKGQRRDIDREYHLHYWDGPDGIEFGWLGPHNDFQLPEQLNQLARIIAIEETFL